MANPQKEDGYVALANDIVDALAGIRLSGEEMQCLWVIIRKTYGWHKKEDKISLSQFAGMTGLKRPAVVRALNHLSQKFIIIKKDNVDIPSYCFQKNYDKWQPLSKKITFIPESKLKSFCYICGFKDVLERHHIISQSKQGSNKVENIIILCPNCHSLTHKGKISQSELLNKKDNVENLINNDNASTQKEEMTLSKKIHTKDILTKETIQKKDIAKISKLPDPEWIETLKKKDCYSHLNITLELEKCLTYFDTKNIKVSRQRFLNWINRNPKPLQKTSNEFKTNFPKKENPLSWVENALKEGWK